MGWNEPDKGKDPWKGKNQPPDLDEALKRVHGKLKKILFGDTGKPLGESPQNSNTGIIAMMIAFTVFLLWVLSGIFIVDPAEQAVILRFGKYIETVGPGLHWIPRIISSKTVVNVDKVVDHSYSTQVLTSDKNLVAVSLVVQYRISDLQRYVFNVANPEDSLQQAVSSAVWQVIGANTLDQVLAEDVDVWASKVQETLAKMLELYKSGILVVNVSPQPIRAPEGVQDVFDDVIKAKDDKKRFIDQANAYAAKIIPAAEGKASRIQQEAEAFSQKVVLRARGEVSEFLALLPQYTAAPAITAEHMYLKTMQRVLKNSSKIIVDSKSSNLLYLPLDKLWQNQSESVSATSTKSIKIDTDDNTDTSSLVDGRDVTRPVYRQGRE
ncbi:MAG: FtsH protease activity modulator HflK [Legionella sp.]|uniref:FtsH protease activity modulator HflK n=1 Tax=Legionella sp. TaxID=459 RepID=UPI0039E3F620